MVAVRRLAGASGGLSCQTLRVRTAHPGEEDRGLLRPIVGDGVPLLLVGAGSLLFAGCFALFLALSGEFLPQDIAYLEMSAADLCSIAQCRVVDFMVHDRAAFGGTLVALGVLYAYLARFPLRRGEAWAWWLLMFSATAGFATFLAYLGYGYLDSWHGVGTTLLLPIFAVGLIRARRLIGHSSPAEPLVAGRLPNLSTREGLGRACLLVGAAAIAVGGLEILRIGVTAVFVPEDLAFMGVSPDALTAINPRLVPLIAHDRAGFGGAVFTTAFTTLGCVWFSRTTRAMWEAICLAGAVSLTAAIGIHLIVGYVDPWHLAPPIAAAASLIIGLGLTFNTAYRTADDPTSARRGSPPLATPDLS
jgi:hypothetical protein